MRGMVAAGMSMGLCACATMQMDEGRVRHHAEKYERAQGGAKPTPEGLPEPGLIDITPEVLTELAKLRAQAVVKAPKDPLEEQGKKYQYRVAPYDVLSVTVWDHPELTIPAGEFRSAEATGHPVYSDGSMFYPHVGVVQVGGRTLPEIREELTQKLRRVIQNPQLDVKVASFRGQKVQVTGEVMAPTALPITDVPMRALDAVTLAKGFSPEADMQRVTLSRDGKAHVLDLQAVNERGDIASNWILRDGDVLHVPDRRESRVFVLGEVKKPSARPLTRGRLTLADALGDAEGVDPISANPGKIYVIRGAFEKPVVYKLDATSPDALLLAIQFNLQPKDVVFVSATELTRWNRVISQILPTVQALWQTFDVTNRAFIRP